MIVMFRARACLAVTRFRKCIGNSAVDLIRVLAKSTELNPVMAKFYDRFCILRTRGLERIWAPVRRTNLLLIGEKTNSGERKAVRL